MDAVMKILKEIERQGQQSRQAPAPAPEVDSRVQRQVGEDRERAAMDKAQSESGQDAEWLIPQDAQPKAAWTRQRILDALALTVALGPPPGLDL